MLKFADKMNLNSLNDLIIAQDKQDDTAELQQSIESSKTGRNYCMVYSNNKVYKGTPGKTTQEIIAEQNVPTGSDIAFINVFNNDIAIIEFLTSRNNMTQIVTAIKSAGQFKKIYSYVDQQGRQIRREASK